MTSPECSVSQCDIFQEEMNLWRCLRECPWNQVAEYLERKTSHGFSSNFIEEIGELLSIIQKQEDTIRNFQELLYVFKQKTHQRVEEKQIEIDQLVLVNSELSNENYILSYTFGELNEKHSNLLRRNKILEQEVLELERKCESNKVELYFAKENIASLQRLETSRTNYLEHHHSSSNTGSTGSSQTMSDTQVRSLLKEKERLLIEEIEKLSERNLSLVEQHQNAEKRLSTIEIAWKKSQAENRALREELCKLFDSNTKESSCSGVRSRRRSKADEIELMKTKEKKINKNGKRSHSSYYTPRSKRKLDSFVDEETRMKLKMLEEIGDEEDKERFSYRSLSGRKSRRFLSSLKLDLNWGLADKSQILEGISLNENTKSSVHKNPVRRKGVTEFIGQPRLPSSETFLLMDTQSLEPMTLRQSLADLWPSNSVEERNFHFFKEGEGSTIYEEDTESKGKFALSKSIFHGGSNISENWMFPGAFHETPEATESQEKKNSKGLHDKDLDNEICEYDEAAGDDEKLVRTIDFQKEEMEVKKSEELSGKRFKRLRRSPTAENIPKKKERGYMRYMTDLSSTQEWKRRIRPPLKLESKECFEPEDHFRPLARSSQGLPTNASLTKGNTGSFNVFGVKIKHPAQINKRVNVLNQQLNLLIEAKITLVKKLSKDIIDTLKSRHFIARNFSSEPHKERIVQILEKANLLKKIGDAKDRALLDLKELGSGETINPTHFAFLLFLVLAPFALIHSQYKKLDAQVASKRAKLSAFKKESIAKVKQAYAYFLYMFLMLFGVFYKYIFIRNNE